MITAMGFQISPWALGLCLCLIPTTRAAAEATETDFDVAPDQVDATAERLAAMDFAEIARPAATVLARRMPEFGSVGRSLRMTDVEYETSRRNYESPAYTVARLVWSKRTEGADAEMVAQVLGEIAADRFRTKPEVRRIAIQALGRGGLSRGTLTDLQRDALYRVAAHGKDDATLRRLAAEALIYAPPTAGGQQAMQHDAILRELPDIVRAQSALVVRHAAFNDLTNIGNRLYHLPVDRFIPLIRVGFGLIEETPAESYAGAYGTARRLGFMLKRSNEFSPPMDEHRDATGNLAPSFFLQTVENAREWWDGTGRSAIDAIAPVCD